MELHAVAGLFIDLQEMELTSWIEHGWVLPDRDGSALVFHEIDIARVRLIHDLRRDMDVQEDMIPLVLSLLDQVYELRSVLKGLSRALEQQPAEIRAAVLAAAGGDKPSRADQV